MKERMEERVRLLSPKVPSSLCQVGGGREHYYEPKNVKFLVRNLDLTLGVLGMVGLGSLIAVPF